MDKTTSPEKEMTQAAPCATARATLDLAFANALQVVHDMYFVSGTSKTEQARLTQEALDLCHEYLAKVSK